MTTAGKLSTNVTDALGDATTRGKRPATGQSYPVCGRCATPLIGYFPWSARSEGLEPPTF